MNENTAAPTACPAPEDEKLGAEITLLAGQINAANYRLLTLIARFDECKAWGGGGTVRSCAHWLNWRCGIAMGAAREKVRVAHCLQNLPLICAAFAAGEVSYSKVRAMTRVATPENEDFLLNIARHGTATHVEQSVSKYRRVRQRCSAGIEPAQRAGRELVHYQDDDGMWVIHARLPAEEGSAVVKAIAAIAEPIREQQRRVLHQRRVSGESRSAGEDTVIDDVSAETFAPAVDTANTCARGDTQARSRADALMIMAEHFLASSHDNNGVRSLAGSERCQVMLHVDMQTLKKHRGADCAGLKHCNLDEDNWVSASTARRLACDASLVTVLEDGEGNVLNIGRRSRTVPAGIRRALALRDKTCRFPGCCESRYVDAHHIEHWADGGETRLDNLVHLCRFHHAQLHSGAFEITVRNNVPAGTSPQLVFTTPSGRVIAGDFYPQFGPDAVATSEQALMALAPRVNAGTAVSRWAGERCDYGMVVEALLVRDGLFQGLA
jgi:hypothetical protein